DLLKNRESWDFRHLVDSFEYRLALKCPINQQRSEDSLVPLFLVKLLQPASEVGLFSPAILLEKQRAHLDLMQFQALYRKKQIQVEYSWFSLSCTQKHEFQCNSTL